MAAQEGDLIGHDNFHLLTSGLFRFELEAAGAAPDGLDAEVMIGVFTIEGLLMHPLSEDQRRAICNTLAARWPRHRPLDHGRPAYQCGAA